jgi:hypothetical protein
LFEVRGKFVKVLFALVLVLPLVGCGGETADSTAASSQATVSPSSPAGAVPGATTSEAATYQVRGSAGDVAFPTSRLKISSATTGPKIERLEVVSARRVDRTVFEYDLRLIVYGSDSNHSAGSFRISGGGTGTTVVKGDVSVDHVGARQVSQSNGLITIRQDRQHPFDESKLVIAFTSMEPERSSRSAYVAIGLYKVAGRPGHEELLPLRGQPKIGDDLVLRVVLNQVATEASFSLIDVDGRALTSGELVQRVPDSSRYVARVQVPARPFAIKIDASFAGSLSDSSSTGRYTPSQNTFDVELQSAVVKPGGTFSGHVVSQPGVAPGDYDVRLLVPDGFTATQASWRVSIREGQIISIPVEVQVGNEVRKLPNRLYLTVSDVEGMETNVTSIPVLIF